MAYCLSQFKIDVFFSQLELSIFQRPDFAAAWMNRGIVKASLKKYVEAEHSYRQGIRHRNNYPDCYYNMGNMVGFFFHTH